MTIARSRIAAIGVAAALLIGGGVVASVAAVNSSSISTSVETSRSLFSSDTVPATPSNPSTTGFELGVKFTENRDITVTGIRFYQGAGNTQAHRAQIWSETGKSLATTTFAASTVSGWRYQSLPIPLKVTQGTNLVASYTAPAGRFPSDRTFFDKPYTDGTITFPIGAGVYSDTPGTLPTKVNTNTNYYVDLVYTVGTANPTTPPVITPTPTPTVTPTPTPTVTPSTGFPNASNTGVPAGTNLTPYTGSLTIQTANTVIDGKTVNGGLRIFAQGVVIKNSVINGTVYNDPDYAAASFTITDSTVNAGNAAGVGIQSHDFTALRVNVTGGNKSIDCTSACTVQDSYVHGQFRDSTGVYHESGIRMGAGSNILHNTIICDAPDVSPDAGCSAGLTGYGDFAIVQNNNIIGNYISVLGSGYCSYGGATGGKPYSAGSNHIVFKDNVYQRRADTGKCGTYGPITSFDSNAPGNVWTNNKYDDGAVVPPAN